MNRFDLLTKLKDTLKDHLIVCNIGLPSQELYKIQDMPNYFYMLGSMGLSSSIGLGLALSVKKIVISIDGDGSILMNMNTLATIGNRAPNNYTLLIAVLLSAQCTDERVNQITPKLFALADNPKDMSKQTPE